MRSHFKNGKPLTLLGLKKVNNLDSPEPPTVMGRSVGAYGHRYSRCIRQPGVAIGRPAIASWMVGHKIRRLILRPISQRSGQRASLDWRGQLGQTQDRMSRPLTGEMGAMPTAKACVKGQARETRHESGV